MSTVKFIEKIDRFILLDEKSTEIVYIIIVTDKRS